MLDDMSIFRRTGSGNIMAALGERACAPDRRDRTAVVDGDGWITHGELHALAARTAGVLAERGVEVGSRVVLRMPDGVGWIAAFLALGRLGAVAVLVNPGLAPAELQAITAAVRPLLTIGTGSAADVDPAWLGRAAERAPETPAAVLGPAAPLYVQFTSGTTGEPKGAVHRHGDLAHHHEAVGRRMLAIGPEDVSLSLSKLYFAYGFGNSLVYPLLSGSSTVLLSGKPDAATVAAAADRFGVTVLHGVPSALAHLVAEADGSAFGRVRVAVSAGERLPPALGEQARDLLGAPVLDELGSTEIGGAWCANTLDDDLPGTIGRPLYGYHIEVRDRAGCAVPDDVVGQLHVSGPTMFAGYLDRPDATYAVLRDGVLATRDTGVRRPDGRFVHTGRVDDIELVGGVNVAPAEIEDLLNSHPAVREAVVAAVPDERGATRLRAFVVPAAPGHDPDQLGAELIGIVRGKLAPFKVPRSVEMVDGLPRTHTGKVRRHVVRTGRW